VANKLLAEVLLMHQHCMSAVLLTGCMAVPLQVPVHCVTLDMRDLDAVAQLPAQLPDEFKEVDILINNAGLALGITTVIDHDIQVGTQATDLKAAADCCSGVGLDHARVCRQHCTPAHGLW
jgi:NAD(P)-dependent dehydrogenase (short-subunit alcohol dehydrogenase family)